MHFLRIVRATIVAFGTLVTCVGARSTCLAQAPVGAATRAAAAQVRSGDVILLHIAREPELSDSIFVTERGEAAFPKLGTLHVASLSIAALEDTLRAQYGLYLRAPSLQVMVLRRVVVNGEVRMPGVFHVDISTTLRDVIAHAGGVTETGDRRKWR